MHILPKFKTTNTLIIVVGVAIILLVTTVGMSFYWFFKLSEKTNSNKFSSAPQQSAYVNEPTNIEFEDGEIANTNIDNPELEVNVNDLYFNKDIQTENQSQSLGSDTNNTSKIRVKHAKKLLFKQYNVLVYFDSSDSWLRAKLIKESNLTIDQLPSTDWQVGNLVYFTKNNQIVYLMPSQNYSIEIVDQARLTEDANLQFQTDYPEYRTIEYVACQPVSAKLSRWKAVECRYKFALQTAPEDKRDNGKIVSCYLPIIGTEKDWLKFSVGIRSAGTTLNMCDLVLQDQLVLVQKL